MTANLESLIHRIQVSVQKHHFSGVVSIRQAGRALFEQAYGYADRSNRIPNQVSTRFSTASGTKFFTALGIGRLIDSGVLSLESRLNELISRPSPHFSPEITIQHLLTHTSGVYDYYDEETITDFDHYFVDIPWFALTTPSDYLPLFQDKPMKFAPGERFSYSNGGYILLGVIIEEASRVLYRDFIHREVFLPCGMADSGFFPLNQLPERAAFGYTEKADGTWQTNFFNLPIIGASDGGAYTTAADIEKLWGAFTKAQVLSPSLTRAFQQPRARVYKEEVSYGFGLYLWKKFQPPALFLVGSDAGVGFDSRHWLKQDLTITILANTTDGEGPLRSAIYDQIKDLEWLP